MNFFNKNFLRLKCFWCHLQRRFPVLEIILPTLSPDINSNATQGNYGSNFSMLNYRDKQLFIDKIDKIEQNERNRIEVSDNKAVIFIIFSGTLLYLLAGYTVKFKNYFENYFWLYSGSFLVFWISFYLFIAVLSSLQVLKVRGYQTLNPDLFKNLKKWGEEKNLDILVNKRLKGIEENYAVVNEKVDWVKVAFAYIKRSFIVFFMLILFFLFHLVVSSDIEIYEKGGDSLKEEGKEIERFYLT